VALALVGGEGLAGDVLGGAVVASLEVGVGLAGQVEALADAMGVEADEAPRGDRAMPAWPRTKMYARFAPAYAVMTTTTPSINELRRSAPLGQALNSFSTLPMPMNAVSITPDSSGVSEMAMLRLSPVLARS